MKHGDLDSLDNFLEEKEPKWDIEDIKQAFINNAKDYDELMKKEKENE